MRHLLHHHGLALFAALALGVALGGCASSPVPESQAKANDLHTMAQQALADFKAKDPSLNDRLRDAYGYAIFPSVGAGAVGVGGAYGKGEVYEKGRMIGYADLSKANIGLSLGGQEYSELILFKDAGALTDFRDGKTTFDAKASAVAATAGGAANADYTNGTMVFANPKSGLMAEASVGGQTFRFTPLKQAGMRPEGVASEEP